MRVKVKLKEMTDAEAQFISLVKRGANGIPFRIQKAGDSIMSIDLSSPMRIFKGSRKGESATVAGILVKKEDAEGLKETIQKAGFDVDKAVEQENGTVFFAQEAGAKVEGTPVRLNEGMVLIMKDFEPWNTKLTSFAERVGLDGYYAGVSTGADSLRSCIIDCIWDADSQDAAVSAMEACLKDAASYFAGIIRAVPSNCWAMEKEMVQKAKADVMKNPPKAMDEKSGCDMKSETKKEGETPVVEVTTTPAAAAPVEETKETAVSDTEKKPDAVVEEPKVEAKKEGETPVVEAPAVVAEPAKEPTIADVLAALSGLKTEILKSVDEKIQGIEGQVKTAVQKSSDLEATLKGTVAAPPPSGDEAPKATVQKASDAEEDALDRGGFVDTAFMTIRGR